MNELFFASGVAVFAIVLTLVFEFINGFHDSANSIATIVATKVLTPIQAVAWAALWNFMGIMIVARVAATIKKGIIDEQIVAEYGIPFILAVLAGAIIWDLITWWFGIPSSSSHALVGGLLGAAGAVAGIAAVNWVGITKVAIFIVLSPVAGMLFGFLIVALVMRLGKKTRRAKANTWCRWLQLVSSGAYSFTHGANDAQKGMGIIMLVFVAEAATNPDIIVASDDPYFWVKVSCHASIALGTFFGGWRIVKTMASRITKLDSYQGFSAETGGASILLITALMGIPVSTTHTISGSIMGVGAAKRLSAVRWGLGRRIVIAWILTIPVAATMSGLIFLTYVHFF